jgi:hypothetical protein
MDSRPIPAVAPGSSSPEPQYDTFPIIFSRRRLADIHAQRKAAGLGRLTDTQMLALLIECGIEHETEAYRDLRECLETIPASMRGPEWDRASEHLDSMRQRGVL